MIFKMASRLKFLVFVRFVLLAIVLDPAVGDFKLRILHTNDMHSRYVEVGRDLARCQSSSKNCFGGFARVMAEVERLKNEAENKKMSSLYLDAGDVFQDTIYFTEYKWKLAAKMMNLLLPDAMSLGNHEFDLGVNGLAKYLEELKPPVLCSNINVDNEPELRKRTILPSKVFDFGKIKVGIVGYLTPQIPSRNLGKVKVFDEIESIRKEAKRLKMSKVKIVIALGHSGFVRDKEIATKVEEVDVVIGGHSHTYLHSGKNPLEREVGGLYPTMVTKESSYRQALIVQAYFGTKYVGCLDLIFDNKGNLKDHTGALIQLKGRKRKDRKVLKALKRYTRGIKKKYGYEIGNTKVVYEGECRIQECNIGNLIADAFVYYAKKLLSEKVHVAIVNAKSIRGSLYPKGKGKSGDILYEDVMTVLPYGNHLKVLKLKGKVLWQALESSVNEYDSKNMWLFEANFLQVSGLKVLFDVTKPVGSRVVSVQVAPDFGQLQEDSSYNVVMSSYMAHDTDKFPSLVNQPVAGKLPKNVREYDALADYIKQHSPLTKYNSKVEGRIVVQK